MRIEELQKIYKEHQKAIDGLDKVITLEVHNNFDDWQVFYANKARAFKESSEFFNKIAIELYDRKDLSWKEIDAWVIEDSLSSRMAMLFQETEEGLKNQRGLQHSVFFIEKDSITKYGEESFRNSCSRPSRFHEVFKLAQEKPVEQLAPMTLSEKLKAALKISPDNKAIVALQKEKLVRRRLAESFCREVEVIYAKTITKDIKLNADQRREVKRILSVAKEKDNTYGKVDYLLGILHWNSYQELNIKRKIKKQLSAEEEDNLAQSLREAYTALSQAIAYKEEKSEKIIDAYFLSIQAAIALNNKDFAKEVYSALAALERHTEYTEGQVDYLEMTKDYLFPEIRQVQEAALEEERFAHENKKHEERAARKAAAEIKKIEKFNIKVERRASDFGLKLPLTVAEKSYFSAYERENELVSIKDPEIRKVMIADILSWYEKAIAANPNYYAAYCSRGLFRLEKAFDASSIRYDFEKLKASESPYYRVTFYYGMGRLAELLGNLADAKEYYGYIMEDEENIVDKNNFLHCDLSRLACLGMEKIVKEYERRFSQIKGGLNNCSDKTQVDNFIRECEAIRDEFFDSYDFHLNLANCALGYLMQGPFFSLELMNKEKEEDVRSYYPIAEEYFEVACQMEPKSVEVYLGLGALYWHLDYVGFNIILSERGAEESSWKKAIKSYSQAISLSPKKKSLVNIIAIFVGEKFLINHFSFEKKRDQLNILRKITMSDHFKNLSDDLKDKTFIYCKNIENEINKEFYPKSVSKQITSEKPRAYSPGLYQESAPKQKLNNKSARGKSVVQMKPKG